MEQKKSKKISSKKTEENKLNYVFAKVDSKKKTWKTRKLC